MKKRGLFLATSVLLSSAAFADALNNTKWQTIDDETGKPKAIVQFSQQANGSFNGTIIKVLDPQAAKACTTCSGALKGKSLQGVTIVRDLKVVSTGKYDGGTILDPKSGKSYKMKSEFAENGKKLTVRGYIGISALGRNQTWVRVN